MNGAKQWISILLAYVLIAQMGLASAVWAAQAAETAEQASGVAVTVPVNGPAPLKEVPKLSSLEIASLAEKYKFPTAQIQSRIQALKNESKKREDTFKAATKQANKQVGDMERQLAQLPTTTTDPEVVRERQVIHCRILALEKSVTDDTFNYLQRQIATDVQISKLQLLQSWREQDRLVEVQIRQGTTGQRRFGNVLDIGKRGSLKPFNGQEDDIAWGKKEVEQARQAGRFPKAIDDPVVEEYVNRLGQNLARNSDLQVPLNVFVVKQEVMKNGKPVLDKTGQPQQVENAMALPGGYLIIYAGLIKAAANESELAGVMAHEMAHVSARHSRRLANNGTAFNILSLAALVGLQLVAPGLFQAASYLGYYLKGLLLQAIFNGLGIVFTLDALGVSRDFEEEADQLGMQYAWKAGYDPAGFIDLFDQMSQKEGYASRTSFFATHPAFGERIINSLKEYKILESVNPNQKYITDSSEFQTIRNRVNVSLRKTKQEVAEEENRPSLNPKEPSDEECQKLLGPATGTAGQAPSTSKSAPVRPATPYGDALSPASLGRSQGHGPRQSQARVAPTAPPPCAAPSSGLF